MKIKKFYPVILGLELLILGTLWLLSPVSTETERGETESSYGAQRVVESELLPLGSSALLLADLQYAARLRVDYGPTEGLGYSAETDQISSHHAVKLAPLESTTTYYYRVTAEGETASSQVAGPLKSFITPLAAETNADATEAIFRLWPAETQEQTTAYLILTDQNGAVITGASAEFVVKTGRATVGSVTVTDGLLAAIVSAEGNEAQTVEVAAQTDGDNWGSASVVISPDRQEKQLLSADNSRSFFASSQALRVIGILSIALLICSTLFWRLAVVK